MKPEDPVKPRTATPLLDYFETGSYLHVSPRMVRKLVAAGELKPVRIGRSVRFERDELDRFISACRVGGEA